MTKKLVQFRIEEDALGNIDEVASILGLSRSSYVAQFLFAFHNGESFNSKEMALELMESNARHLLGRE